MVFVRELSRQGPSVLLEYRLLCGHALVPTARVPIVLVPILLLQHSPPTPGHSMPYDGRWGECAIGGIVIGGWSP